MTISKLLSAKPQSRDETSDDFYASPSRAHGPNEISGLHRLGMHKLEIGLAALTALSTSITVVTCLRSWKARRSKLKATQGLKKQNLEIEQLQGVLRCLSASIVHAEQEKGGLIREILQIDEELLAKRNELQFEQEKLATSRSRIVDAGHALRQCEDNLQNIEGQYLDSEEKHRKIQRETDRNREELGQLVDQLSAKRTNLLNIGQELRLGQEKIARIESKLSELDFVFEQREKEVQIIEMRLCENEENLKKTPDKNELNKDASLDFDGNFASFNHSAIANEAASSSISKSPLVNALSAQGQDESDRWERATSEAPSTSSTAIMNGSTEELFNVIFTMKKQIKGLKSDLKLERIANERLRTDLGAN